MAIINQPELLTGAIAEHGDKNTIPQTADSTQGLASISEGFPQITSQPIVAGGVPPKREDFNGLFNMISQFLLYYQNGGVGNYNASLDYAPTQIAAHNGTIWMCLKLNGANTSVGAKEPNSDNTEYWQELGGGLMQGATASADGKKGIVPAPKKGEQNMFLQGNGKWGNPPFYPITGGNLNGNIYLTGADFVAKQYNGGIFCASNFDNLNNNAQNLGANKVSNLNIVSWNGVTFGTTQGHENDSQPYYEYKSTVGVDCRNGIFKTQGDIISNNNRNLSNGVVTAYLSGANGYCQFANGMTFQWGRIYDIQVGGYVSFPITYSNYCEGVVATDMASDNSNRPLGVYDTDQYGFRIRANNNSTVYAYWWSWGW